MADASALAIVIARSTQRRTGPGATWMIAPDPSGSPMAAECSRAGTDSDHTGRSISAMAASMREQGTPLRVLGIERGKESLTGLHAMLSPSGFPQKRGGGG